MQVTNEQIENFKETLKKTPYYTSKPLLCHIRHKETIFAEPESPHTRDAIKICTRCGEVQEGWFVFYGFAQYTEHFEIIGYMNPKEGLHFE